MSRFKKLTVKSITKDTDEAVVIELNVPKEKDSDFNFIQGQYLTFKKEISGEELRRSYSICTAPHENKLKVLVKQIPDGRFSTFANQHLKIGDELETMPPMGNFSADLNHKNEHVFFAAGSGITPIISNIKAVLHNSEEAQVSLYFLNRTKDSILQKEELEALKNTYIDRFKLYYFFSREISDIPMFNGRFSDDKLKEIKEYLLKDNISNYQYYICGPEEMIFTISDYLKDNGVEKSNIHFELFTSSSSNNVKENVEKVDDSSTSTNSEMADITIKIDGDTTSFKMKKNFMAILDKGVEEGADLPYSCKGGVCCTCRAKVIEGKVNMEINYALEEEEVEKGYVLSCQSFPITDKVYLSFDD